MDSALDKSTATAEDILQIVAELVRELRAERAQPSVRLDSSFDRDLGLDSLARAQLLSRLEQRFGVRLPESLLAEADTPRDLWRAIGAARGRAIPSEPPTGPVTPLQPAQAAPHDAATLIDVLAWHARQHPARPHIRIYRDGQDGTDISYGELWARAAGIAAGLQDRQIAPGTPIAIMLPTSPDYFFVFFGILLAGGIPVSLYPPTRRAQLADHLLRQRGILLNCRAALLITVADARAYARTLKATVATLREVVTTQELAGAARLADLPSRSAADTAFLQYTSGSTGDPKGVILSHANLLANIRAMGAVVEARSEDVFVSWLPLYHDMGLIGAWLGSLYFASLFVVMSPLEFLARPARWLRAISRYGGTLSAAPNFGYDLCLRYVTDADLAGCDLRSWRCAFNGAEPVSVATTQSFAERFGRFGFRPTAMMPVFGLAESSVGLAFPPLGRGPVIERIDRTVFMTRGRAQPATPQDPNPLPMISCGRPLPGHETRIVDETGRELPDGIEGELQFRGPSSTSGYYRNAEATRRLFDDAWLRSGDRGYMRGGELYISGRSKDLIIRGGRNIYPQELEAAVSEIDGIRAGRVAVFGVPSETAGTERLIVLAETRQHDADMLTALRGTVNDLVVQVTGSPADDVILCPPSTVLKTSSGKIRRAACRELYESGDLNTPRASLWRQSTRIARVALTPLLRRWQQAWASMAFAAWAWLCCGLLTALTWPAVLLLRSLPARWRAIGIAITALAALLRIPFTIHGRENLPAPEQPAVFVANHASYLDGPIVIAALPYPASFVAKAELRGKIFARLFLERIGTFFVERFERQQSMTDALALAQVVAQGQRLAFFPEGTFTRRPGLLSFRMGAFASAAGAGAPIVPITIRGTRGILRSDTWFPRPGRIELIIGKPIWPDIAPTADEPQRWRIALRLREATRAAILKELGEPDLADER